MKVLVIEDNEGDQRAIAEAFKNCDPSAQLVFADMADQGMDLLKSSFHGSRNGKAFKLIILDLNLPQKNGKDFLREIKSDKKLSQIPVLVLTSSNAESDVCDCYSFGASCYLKKPMRFPEFQTMIDAICKFWLKEVTFARIEV